MKGMAMRAHNNHLSKAMNLSSRIKGLGCKRKHKRRLYVMVSKILALKKVYSNLSEHDQGFELAKQD